MYFIMHSELRHYQIPATRDRITIAATSNFGISRCVSHIKLYDNTVELNKKHFYEKF